MKDILTELFEIYGYDRENVKYYVCGNRYTAVMLVNGNIGVCANLGNGSFSNGNLPQPDLTTVHGRIFLNAYYAALLNYRHKNLSSGDIFTNVEFGRYHNIVMIGAFFPLMDKFEEAGIPVSVFDRVKEGEGILPDNKQAEYLTRADCVIATSTTIFNNTFCGITDRLEANADLFLLGPSSILAAELFECGNLKGIFGTLFENNDKRVVDLIGEGYGSRTFTKLGKKVELKKSVVNYSIPEI